MEKTIINYSLKKLFNRLSIPFKQLFLYPNMILSETNYNDYWINKRGDNLGYANCYQKQRANWIVRRIEEGSTVLDIGCGDGAVLLHMKKQKEFQAIGVDMSEIALDFLDSQGIKTCILNINEFNNVEDLPVADYIMMLEILEHMQNPEKFLGMIQIKAIKGFFFSFPNTGYFMHRLRFFFGSFPLQWRVHPGEHLRFWTYRDLKWWLKKMGLKDKSRIYVYQGIPVLNIVLRSLFGAAFIVEVRK
jgi:methionine biosynthesis protein MetW